MNKPFFTLVAAILLSGFSAAIAQTNTTTTTSWTDDQGKIIREYSTTKHYSSVNDPNLKIVVGAEVPSTVKVYALPDDMKVTDRDNYSYVIINDQPVVVERTTRKVVHTW